ncbi:MAG TPA: helix-turn-helix transcriptional regulator [Terracidiphilus sp.]|nr:helix-turn-helix transcriptional regulator [Terracidiphilus sp.]
MTGKDLKSARTNAGWTQEQAASRLGLTQEYLSMVERGHRPVSAALMKQALRVLDFPPTSLPVAESGARLNPNVLQAELGALGYPGFSYLRGTARHNPAELLFFALDRDELDVRLVEALPWLAHSFPAMDWKWLTRQAKLNDRQNRLGFVVAQARQLKKGGTGVDPARLAPVEEVLERSRLVHEDTLCRESMTGAERRWLRKHRPATARHWNLLTDLDVRNLPYAAA